MKTHPLIQQISSTTIPEGPEEHLSSKHALPLKPKIGKCVVCNKKCSYRCPKCRKNYCSIQHFRSHNLFCSEDFFEKQVKQSLKSLKVRDQAEKKKAVEMVNEYRQEVDSLLLGQPDPQRLQQVLKEIESGGQPNLTPKEETLFQQYLAKVMDNEATEDEVEIEKPYWEIDEGLSLYLLQSVEVEDYGDSENMELVARRTLYKQQLDQFFAMHPYTETVIRPVLYLHLIQLVYSYVLLFRAYDGEPEAFESLFISAYCSKENERLLKTEEVSMGSLAAEIEIQLLRSQGEKEANTVLSLWMRQYWDLLEHDLSVIFKNTLLILETLLRVMELASSPSHSQLNNESISTVGQTSLSKQEKQERKSSRKVLKKCEYLLYFVKYFYRKQNCQVELQKLFGQKRSQQAPSTEESPWKIA